jgi:GntR family transcriptional repressor for pyruvate dehydrogenase complex
MSTTTIAQPGRRPLLVDEVITSISSMIRSRGLRPGERLPTEAELAVLMGCSRNVLREAIGRLTSLGLVEVRRGTGMFVGTTDCVRSCAILLRSSVSTSPQDLVEFAEFRRVIEGYAARRAALRASEAELLELRELATSIDETGISREESLRRDQAFHLRLMAIGGNRMMAALMESLLEFLHASMDTTTATPRDTSESLRLHAAITDALSRRDPAAADEAMELNLQHTMRRLSAIHGDEAGQPAAIVQGDEKDELDDHESP